MFSAKKRKRKKERKHVSSVRVIGVLFLFFGSVVGNVYTARSRPFCHGRKKSNKSKRKSRTAKEEDGGTLSRSWGVCLLCRTCIICYQSKLSDLCLCCVTRTLPHRLLELPSRICKSQYNLCLQRKHHSGSLGTIPPYRLEQYVCTCERWGGGGEGGCEVEGWWVGHFGD